MRRLLKVVVPLALLALPGRASAGKVENVKSAVREACKREIPIESVVNAVVRAYDCEPGQDVTIAGCKIKCLKGADGNVVGK
jgi:hypothetical protein